MRRAAVVPISMFSGTADAEFSAPRYANRARFSSLTVRWGGVSVAHRAGFGKDVGRGPLIALRCRMRASAHADLPIQ